jgi:hypothetical protein
VSFVVPVLAIPAGHERGRDESREPALFRAGRRGGVSRFRTGTGSPTRSCGRCGRGRSPR